MTTLEGPVESIGGRLSLRIPLALVDSNLAASLHGAAAVDGAHLTLAIPVDVCESLGLVDRGFVSVDDRGGNFTILPLPTVLDPSSDPARITRAWRVSAERRAPLLELGRWSFFAGQ